MKVRRPVKVLYDLLVRHVPFDGQVIVTRRCNLQCGYCSEFDKSSPIIPLEVLKRRVDHLQRLGVVEITFLGGEPLLHPDIAGLVRYARPRCGIVSMTTNGTLLTRKMISDLNEAGLDHMQISIDALVPDKDRYIIKSLRPLRSRLAELKATAKFDVHLAAVLCERTADQVGDLFREADEMGIPIGLSVCHDDTGRKSVWGEPYISIWEDYRRREHEYSIKGLDGEYSAGLLRGEDPHWQCRSGSRYLYIDEFGMVQFCSMQRGRLNVPLEHYSRRHIRDYGKIFKGCERGCSNDCVFRSSEIDNNRMRVVRSLLKSYLLHPKDGHRKNGQIVLVGAQLQEEPS